MRLPAILYHQLSLPGYRWALWWDCACCPAPTQIQHMRQSLRVLGLRNPLGLFLGPHKPHALLSTGGDCCSRCRHAVISDGFLWLAAVLNWPCSQLTPLDSHQALLRERSYFSLLYFFFLIYFSSCCFTIKIKRYSLWALTFLSSHFDHVCKGHRGSFFHNTVKRRKIVSSFKSLHLIQWQTCFIICFINKAEIKVFSSMISVREGNVFHHMLADPVLCAVSTVSGIML